MPDEAPAIAIVGLGPRGLFALEALLLALAEHPHAQRPALVLFESGTAAGAGPHHRPDQDSHNLLNLCVREMTLHARPRHAGPPAIEPFPSFANWMSEQGYQSDGDQDLYPARALCGRYLVDRLATLLAGLDQSLPLIIRNTKIVRLEVQDDRSMYLYSEHGQHEGRFDRVLLALGHQQTQDDTQLLRWQQQARTLPGAAVFATPYPIEPLRDSAMIHSKTVVATRGFGLTMFDVMRALTSARGGRFVQRPEGGLDYRPGGREPKCIAPWSLDGLPAVPKPLNAEIDARFAPNAEERARFREAVQSGLDRIDRQALKDTVVQATAACVAERWGRTASHLRYGANTLDVEDIEQLCAAWLNDERHRHPALSDHQASLPDLMQALLDMAEGRVPARIDYLCAQVWRGLFDLRVELLSHAGLSAEQLADTVALDRRLKRYTFGPPAQSLHEALALHRAGLMQFAVCEDPDVEQHKHGWRLQDRDATIIANVIINTVLDSTDLAAVIEPLPQQLLRTGALTPLGDSFGAITEKDARVRRSLDAEHSAAPELAVVGRLATGSVFEADSLPLTQSGDVQAWAQSTLAWLQTR